VGLELEFDARDLSLSDGEKVASWPDSSGNERDVAQAEEAKQPLLKTGILGGKPVVRFDGLEDFLKATGFELAQPNTVFVVGRGSTAGAFVDGGVDTSHRHLIQRIIGPVWGISAGTGLTGGTADSDFHVFTAVFDGAASRFLVDGATTLEGNAGAQALEGLAIGARFDGTANRITGDIAAIRVYGTALSAPEIAAVEAALTRTWFGGAVGSLGGPGQPLSRRNRIVNP
jgi:hypothetical protein